MTDGILAGPIRIHYAPEGTTEPAPATAQPPSPWQLLGGGKYEKQGIEGVYDEEWSDVDTLADTFPTDAFRSREDIEYSLRQFDCRPEALQILFGNNPITEVARTRSNPGYRQLNFFRGQQIDKYAVLVVGRNPYPVPTEEMGLNIWHPRAAFRGPGLMRFQLANPTVPEVRIRVFWHNSLGAGGLTANYEPINYMPTLTAQGQTGTAGTEFSFTPTRTSGNAPFMYVATGLPPWATINANTGEITGIAAAGLWQVTVTVVDADGDMDSALFGINISAP